MKTSSPDAQHFILGRETIQGHLFLGFIPMPRSDQTITPKASISQVIYRNGTTYSDSVSPNFKGKLKVYKGDYVYSISLAPRTYHFDGVITTKEGKQRGYDMHVEMGIVNASRFMDAYDHGQDPAFTTFTYFKRAFEYYASRMEEITEANLNPWLNRQATTFTQDYGVQVMRPVWFLHPSQEIIKPEDANQVLLRRKREIDLDYDIKIHEERRKGDLERARNDIKEWKNEFARSEQKKRHVFDEQIRLLSKTVDSLIQINNERVSDNIGYNIPPQAILQDSLKLLASLNNSLDNTSQAASSILDSTPLDSLPMDEDQAENDEDGPDTTVPPMVSPSFDSEEARREKATWPPEMPS